MEGGDWVPLTDELRSQLADLRDRSGIGPQALLRGSQADRPKGLSSDKITRWMRRAKKARKDHLDYVLNRWHSLVEGGESRVAITQKIRKKLQTDRDRTGINPRQLLKQAGEAPGGLTAAVIWRWLTGDTQTARKDHLEFVLEAWASHPDDQNPIDINAERVELTPLLIAKLKRLRNRSGISVQVLFKGAKPPAGLSEEMVNNWLNGATSTAAKHHVAYVSDQWAELSRERGPRIEITDSMRERLWQIRDRSGMGAGKLLQQVKEPPAGLTVGVIAGWLNGQGRTAYERHWNFVIEAWEALAD